MPMTPRLPDDDPAPRHHRVFTVLRGQIIDGHYSPDAPMPGEIELSGMFAVSRVTVRRALERLQREGFIERRQGVGTFARPQMPGRTQQGDLAGFIDNLLLYGLKTDVRVLEFGYVNAPRDIAQQLGVRADEKVQKAVRLRSYQGRPLSHVTTFIPEAIGRRFTRHDIEQDRLLALLNEASGGIASAHQRISATAADPTVASLLDVDYGSPLLSITRVVRDADDRPINHLRALYRPDAYEFAMDLSTDPSPDGPLWQPSVSVSRGKVAAGN